MAHIVLLGTCDTKLDEILFLRSQILRNRSIEVTLIDAGHEDVEHDAITMRPSQLKKYKNSENAPPQSRGESLDVIAKRATHVVKHLYRLPRGNIHGIIAVGGSGGTSVASTVMKNSLPLGFPKIIVSTVASGDTGPIIEETDITLMYSVVDIAGLNAVLCKILSNAGAAISGMALSYASRLPSPSNGSENKKRVGITMFGVTTPAVDEIRRYLEANYDIECYVFHATGHGGKAMERLVREGGLDAVLDLTTTEICDYLTGGNMSAGSHRLEAAAAAGIPNIISLGATDMTNFGPKDTVPERYKSRFLFVHNSFVTLMLSSAEECRQVGEFIVEKLRNHVSDASMVEVWIPMGGVSLLSSPDGVFVDREADAELFRTVKQGLLGSYIAVIEDDRSINDPSFGRDIADALLRKMGIAKR